MKCYHTGLPKSMCGHCNGTSPLEVEPFTGGFREDTTPRLFKGRDKTEWRGLGESLDTTPNFPLLRANAPRFDRTAWARDIAMRDALNVLRMAQDLRPIAGTLLDLAKTVQRESVTITPDTRNIDGQVVVGAKHKPPTPRRYFTEGSQVMRHARAQGGAGRVLASVKRKIGV